MNLLDKVTMKMLVDLHNVSRHTLRIPKVWQLTAVKTTPQKTRFRDENMQEFVIQIEWTMTGHNRTTTFRRKEICPWYCVCVVKCS